MQANDIYSPDLYLSGVPYDRFERLRREAPVSWQDETDGPGFWAVTKHRDVLEVLKDPATFSSQKGTFIPDLPESDMRRSPNVLANMDPPRHNRYRALVAQAFTRLGVARIEQRTQQLVSGLLDEVVERGRFDFIDDFAGHIPMAVILDMVGVPPEGRQNIMQWVPRLLAGDDPEFATSPEERMNIGRRFAEYAHALAAERRSVPRDDLLSLLMAAEVDGEKLTYEEFSMFFMLLLAAGTESTRLLIGSGMHALIRHPAQRERLVERPALMASAVEEVLRYHSPLMNFRRTATRDTELRGQRIRAGQKVVVWMISANRDEDVFERPDDFDVERTPNDHLAFGHGPHFCLGNSLARMEARVALAECIKRLEHVELVGPPVRVRSNWLNGLKRMPVQVTRR
jgi:cholest-4-en-3-one 26-monooxygenase